MSLLTIFEFLAIFIGLLIFIFCAKKIYYHYVLKKKLVLIPRPSTKGIANIGVTLALSISVVIFLIIVTANIASAVFRLWAGTRVIIESILIKIGGLLYGPIIGMCLGAATDFLCVSLTAGVFHIGYFISAILFGLVGGIIRTLLTKSKFKFLLFSINSTIICLLISIAVIFLLYWSNNIQVKFNISFLGVDILLTIDQIVLIFVIFMTIPIFVLWVAYFIYNWQLKNNKSKSNWFGVFAPIFITITVSEVLCNILFLPVFDQMLSPLNYQTWFAIRLLLFIPMVAINLIILLPVYKIIKPTIKYNYEEDIISDIECKRGNKLVTKKKLEEKSEVINERKE